ncbi:hypothetical protein P691DRAFT_797224 [Macrolepiota fuliginosa MF-IS2]|uniref:START domain-containing protein n=1 Tax=Macrolepiota fuliginosa MF-IS2 TaxID=1400762 RepID=A0A9P5XPB9_9AGAR|nr:hypothetical protein P691DRAFT_797224 [Macrolepiota fuliginosa MF-IS2]
MSDGSRLRQSWYNALNDAESRFRQLLTSSGPSDWKRISTAPESPTRKGKARVSAVPELADVIVHRHTGNAGDDVYRMVLDVAVGDESVSLESWKAVLMTPELRQEWDPAVEEAHLVEMFDHKTRISKTNFTLGWPANPRDAVTISRLFHDSNTVIDISTSLPRSADEPAYLRPSPPFVRSHVKLFAWCIQLLQSQPQSSNDDQAKKKFSRLRITCFWQHDLKAMWGFNSSTSSMAQQLSTMTLSLFKTVIKRGGRVAKLSGYGNGVSVDRIRYQIDREALTVEYAIIPEEDEHTTPSEQIQGMEEVHSLREQRRLTRSIECVLPYLEGWDVQVVTKGSSEEAERLPWSANALRTSSSSSSSGDEIVLRLTHTALPDAHTVLKVKATIEVSAGSRGIRLNGIPKPIVEAEERDPSSHFISQTILQDIASTADLSFNTVTSVGTRNSAASTSSSVNVITRTATERSAAGEKSILSRVRRNYIYFSSLLQEPEAKWRRTTEARGVSITQLDSIDPTLVVYRAEATFVGVGLWDLFATVVSPGARIFWDKQHEDGVLLEDVNELTELWHYKTKPAWPVNGRDSVLLKTVYKSPNTIHVFSFSADEPHLFPNVPLPEPNVIRTQVDLQGWSIEALSPTTTLLTLLEQSDPKGWTNKTSIPNQMINTLAGIGEFAIKCGGPPVVTRLAGARVNEIRYDHEKASFRVEYEASASRRANANNNNDDNDSHSPAIELELRCDTDTWAASLDIVVDPPPQTISCLRRHRLSAEGGGLWLTLAHDALFVDDERLLTIVRKAPGKEKGLVMVNGAKVQVDVEEIPEHEMKALAKQKRVKPVRIPLDQPPVMSNIRKKRAEWGDSGDVSPIVMNAGVAGATKPTDSPVSAWASAPRISSPLTRFFTYYVDQATTTTQQAVAAIAPTNISGDNAVPSSSKLPLQYALESLSWVQDANGQTLNNDWTLVSDKGMLVHRKTIPEVSPFIPVHRGAKVIEGVSAEELAPMVTHWDCRRKWDDRFDNVKVLESYGADSQTAFLTSRAGFPFRDRGFYLASVVVRGSLSSSSVGSSLPPSLSRQVSADGAGTSSVAGVVGGDHSSSSSRRAIYCVSASFSPDSVASFAPAKYNPHVLPVGRVYIDAWILETLDPYTKENYMIPSTRCTRYIAVDYAGSIPAAVNSMINASIPRCILALEAFVKGSAPLPVLRLPAPSLVEEMLVGLKATAWKLRRRDENRTAIWEKFMVEEKVLSICVEVCLPTYAGKGRSASVSVSGDSIGGGNGKSETGTQSQLTTPRPSRMVLKSPGPEDKKEGSSSFMDSGSEITITPSNSDAMITPTLSMVPPSIAPARQRQRTVSSIAAFSPIVAAASAAFEEQRRGRSASAFTVRGEVRPPGDLVVAEVVVDKKMYPDGYEVKVRSKMRRDVKVGQRGGFVPLWDIVAKPPGEDQTGSAMTSDNVLPLKYAVYAMPLSPMHSSGEAGTRHLIRVVLPTAQVERMGSGEVKDPLTGEVRGAPEEKPQWWNDMIDCGGAVVWVDVVPAAIAGTGDVATNVAAAGSVDKGSMRKRSRKETSGKGEAVTIDGKEVVVIDEKEALTSLGRDELMDDRVGKMNVISRVPNDSEALPDELKTPVGIADSLCDSGSSTTSVTSSHAGNGGEEKKDGKAEAKSQEEQTTDGETPKTTGENKDKSPHVSHAVPSSGGLLGFLQGYPNPLTRFGVGMGGSVIGGVGDKGKGKASGAGANTNTAGSEKETLTVPGGIANEMGVSKGSDNVDVDQQVKEKKTRASAYPMSTLLVVAVIAFLLGSLLRSLISPADFVYVGGTPPQVDGGGGWRELRRLFEVKYVFGGWDLQIAAVRRHER